MTSKKQAIKKNESPLEQEREFWITRTELKKAGLVVAEMLSHSSMGEKQLQALRTCGTYLLYKATFDKTVKKNYRSNFCHNRFCPFCAVIRSRKDSMLINTVMELISKKEHKKFIFGTLTVPNVPGEELADTIKQVNHAWKKMMARKKFSAVNKGYVRKLEVEYNAERNDFHPHLHFIMAVNWSYLTDKHYFISQPVWLQQWQDVMGDRSIKEIKVKSVSDREGSVQELAKYESKDIVKNPKKFTNNAIDYYYRALKGKQKISFNGLFRQYRSVIATIEDKAKKGEQLTEKEERVNELLPKDMNTYYWWLQANWAANGYGHEYQKMTPEEVEQNKGDGVKDEPNNQPNSGKNGCDSSSSSEKTNS